MTICPKCEMPIKTGQRFKGEFVGIFKEEPSGIHHAVAIEEEKWLEHETCQYANEGD